MEKRFKFNLSFHYIYRYVYVLYSVAEPRFEARGGKIKRQY